MTQDTVPLDERGLEAAVRECARTSNPEITDAEFAGYRDNLSPLYTNTKRDLELIIRAYLQTAAADVSGLVERLRERAESYRMGGPSSEHTAALLDEAASTIQTLSASNAALEAEIERLRVALKQTEYLMTKDSFSAAERLSEGLAHVRQARAALSAPKGGQDE